MQDNPPQVPARHQAWSEYWASGTLHSCATSYGGNYAGAIGGFWADALGRLPPGARVLDLATGNGAIPALLWRLHGAAVQVDAVDLAALAPRWLAPEHQASIRFHAGVDIEALPFGDASFACVTSQFGFEYAGRAAALAEAVRVAGMDGWIHLVMHHHCSRLVEVGREELRHHQWLGSEDGLLAAARAVVPVLAAVRGGCAPDAVALQTRERYNRALARIADEAAASPAPDLLLEAREAVHGLVAAVGPDPCPVLDQLDRLAGEWARARLRSAEMVECALDRAQLEALANALRQARPHWDVALAELAQAEGVLAWALSAGPSTPG